VSIGQRVAARFARWVRDAPPERLEALDGVRARVLVGAIFRAMPRQFSKRAAGTVRAAIEWRVNEPDGGATVHTILIHDGRCQVRYGPLAEPDLVIETSVPDFLRLAAGVDKGPVLFATGRMRLRGDVGLALRLSMMFLVPQAQATRR
jgi:hypothetical protein